MPRHPNTPETDDESFGARLRRFRITEQLTINQSAQEFGVAVGTLRGWENGKMPSNPELYNKIVKILEQSEKD